MTRSEIMSRIKSKGTGPEMLVKRVLDAANVGYEYQPAGIVGKPDFRVGRTLLFVDGCFWHGCPLHFKMPKSNAEFWQSKISANMNHDKFYDWHLGSEGWTVRRIWEHDLKVKPR